MAATPCPGHRGCKCPYCYGLAEYALEHLGTDYGLPRTWKPVRVAPQPAPEPPVQLTPRVTAPQPWEPRPSRRSLRMAA